MVLIDAFCQEKDASISYCNSFEEESECEFQAVCNDDDKTAELTKEIFTSKDFGENEYSGSYTYTFDKEIRSMFLKEDSSGSTWLVFALGESDELTGYTAVNFEKLSYCLYSIDFEGYDRTDVEEFIGGI